MYNKTFGIVFKLAESLLVYSGPEMGFERKFDSKAIQMRLRVYYTKGKYWVIQKHEFDTEKYKSILYMLLYLC